MNIEDNIKIIEIKAICNKHDVLRKILKQHKAQFLGLDEQLDTYFNVPKGRMKLRQGNIEQTLIYYDRVNIHGPKRSDVKLYKPQADANALKKLLASAMGIMVEVRKKREIYFIDNIKIHLDQVDGLGSFVEIEAIDSCGRIPIETLRDQCDSMMNSFEIKKSELISSSYSDMLMEKFKSDNVPC